MASDFSSGIACSSNEYIRFQRFNSSICSASAFRLVEPTRTKTPCSGPSRSR
jgi:hypothetical protein